jgi:hypothetical protein
MSSISSYDLSSIYNITIAFSTLPSCSIAVYNCCNFSSSVALKLSSAILAATTAGALAAITFFLFAQACNCSIQGHPIYPCAKLRLPFKPVIRFPELYYYILVKIFPVLIGICVHPAYFIDQKFIFPDSALKLLFLYLFLQPFFY